MSATQKQLVDCASSLLIKKFKKGAHHVSSAVRCGDKTYTGIHLDSDGFDICAEPVAIANAVLNNEQEFDEIVTMWWNGDPSKEPEIIPPCGDCRQLLIKFAPSIKIILADGENLITPSARDLLPFSYNKPQE